MVVNTPLRRLRRARKLTLQQLSDAIWAETAVRIDTGSLSRIEQAKQGASPETAAAIAQFFGRDAISELEILYPERYPEEPATPVAAAVV